MRDLFEAIAEYMSAEGADARREHAKKVRIEFDLVQDRMQEMQSRIEALEKDAERFLKLAAHMTFSLDGDYVTMDFSCPVDATKTHDVHDDWIEPRFTDSVRRTVDTALQSEKGGV